MPCKSPTAIKPQAETPLDTGPLLQGMTMEPDSRIGAHMDKGRRAKHTDLGGPPLVYNPGYGPLRLRRAPD